MFGFSAHSTTITCEMACFASSKRTTVYAKFFTISLLISISASLEHLKFISDCSPYKDTSCSIRCKLYQCADSACGSDRNDIASCEQNIRIQSYNFIELTDGHIAISLKYDILLEELSNLTKIFLTVGSLDETHFVAVFSQMDTSDYPVFIKEVISEFPIPEVQREDEVAVKFSTNICGSPKNEVLKIPKYLVVNQSLVAKYHDCPDVQPNPAGKIINHESPGTKSVIPPSSPGRFHLAPGIGTGPPEDIPYHTGCLFFQSAPRCIYALVVVVIVVSCGLLMARSYWDSWKYRGVKKAGTSSSVPSSSRSGVEIAEEANSLDTGTSSAKM